jgi:hypothetical protein
MMTAPTHPRRQWSRALALLSTLVILPTGFSYTVYRCRIDGIARRACCCPHARTPQDRAVERPCCCDTWRQQVRAARGVSEVERARIEATPAVAAIPAAPPLAPSLVPSYPAAANQPRAGPLIFVLKRSFLL